MINHNKIRNITNDVIAFYLKVKDLDYSDASWDKRTELGSGLLKKYKNDRLCIDLVNAYMNEMRRDDKEESSGKDRRKRV